MTWPEARDLARELALAATDGKIDSWIAGANLLEQLDVRSWLLLDAAARTFSYTDGTPVGGTRRWLGTSAAEPTGFVAAVTSLHADGRIRQRAVRMLAKRDARIAAIAIAVRSLDHVPQVRDEAQRSDDDLVRMLADRAPRVRAAARGRVQGRGIDAADWYRRQLDLPTTPARTLAACLDGLAATGEPRTSQHSPRGCVTAALESEPPPSPG